ncbi:MAG: VCBS repeat-containing protein, partial [Lentisphaeria bacterium]|nr:VCBS repeat-containing protein [Lentisphaeria bacterium]
SDSGWEVRAIGDFSGDGRDDIVAFHKETGLVAMWGDGNAANWSKIGQLDASDWFIAGCGDYDGDGADDLLVRQYSTGMLGYYSSGDQGKWVELGRGVDMNWTVIA